MGTAEGIVCPRCGRSVQKVWSSLLGCPDGFAECVCGWTSGKRPTDEREGR